MEFRAREQRGAAAELAPIHEKLMRRNACFEVRLPMSKLACLTALLLVLPPPALAQIVFQDAPVVPPPTKAEKSKSDMDKIVCRSQETIGSRLERQQVCLTKQQWLSAEQEAKLKVHDMQVIGLKSN
jgi:hypothetical protein